MNTGPENPVSILRGRQATGRDHPGRRRRIPPAPIDDYGERQHRASNVRSGEAILSAAVRKRLIAESPFADMKGTAVEPIKIGNSSSAARAAEGASTLARMPSGGCCSPCAATVAYDAPQSPWRCAGATSTGNAPIDRDRAPRRTTTRGRELGLIPIFPELRPYLEDAHELADRGDRVCHHAIPGRERESADSARADYSQGRSEPWAKPFQNLRSTRETELAETYPIHVVCAWIGNSEAVRESTTCKSPMTTLIVREERCKNGAAGGGKRWN